MASVPFFNYPHVFKSNEEELTRVMLEVCRKGAFILQKELVEFEQQLASFLSVKHAIGLADGTEAIVLGLEACGVGPGDEVIVPSHTFIATVSAVHFVGATPILVECGRDHLVDPKAIERAITPKTKAILPVHLNGRTCDMEAITRIASSRDLMIVEDAAQGLGARLGGRAAGTFGHFGTFSFYPAKSLGCFGDGGALVTNSDAVAQSVRLMRDHGRDEHGDIARWGYNCRLDNLQAAVLSVKLRDFPREIERRRRLAAIYFEELNQVSQVVLPPTPGQESNRLDTFQNFEIEADRRDELKQFLKDNGVGTLMPWGGKAVHQFKKLGLHFELPITDRVFERCLMIPMNTSLTDEDVRYVSQMIKKFYQRA